MNRGMGSQLASENVKEGMTLWVKTRNLGQALVVILKDRGVGGWLAEIVDGNLASPVDPKRRWRKGEKVGLPIAGVDKFYELAGGGEE